MANEQAVLIIANSEVHSDLYYKTQFLAPDPFIFIEANGRKTMVMSDLEVDRARAQARVDEVLSYSEVEARLKKQGIENPNSIAVTDAILKGKGIKNLLVPADFGFRHAEGLQSRGYELTTKAEPFFEDRRVKTEEEIQAIVETQAAVETAVSEAVEVLRESSIKNGNLVWKNGVLTSEALRKIIHIKLMEHADMTRTVVKGRASDALKKLYDTVKTAQEEAVGKVKDGASGQDIHQGILDRFEKAGYQTGMKDGRMQGFFHGTGHGLGLDIHEPPRISRGPWTLKTGQVVTVEPGLYYPDIGAVRIEDMVVVTETGCRNLTQFPKFLEI